MDESANNSLAKHLDVLIILNGYLIPDELFQTSTSLFQLSVQHQRFGPDLQSRVIETCYILLIGSVSLFAPIVASLDINITNKEGINFTCLALDVIYQFIYFPNALKVAFNFFLTLEPLPHTDNLGYVESLCIQPFFAV